MTKKRRYLISAAVLAACVCIMLGALAMLPPRPGVTKANFDRIEEGATWADVEASFGCAGCSFNDDMPGSPFRSLVWVNDDDGSYAMVDFDNKVVTQKVWRPSTETLPDKLRRWFGMGKQGPQIVREEIQ